MRIGLVILHGDAARGGAERYTVDLGRALRSRGHDVALIASSFAEGASPEANVLLKTGSATRSGKYLQFLDQLDRHLSQQRYDIVHAMLPVRQCNVYHPHAGIAAEAIRSGHLKYEGAVMQVISQVANRMNRRRQRFAAIEKSLLTSKKPPLVVCLSKYVRSSLSRHYAIDDAHLATLFNATDLSRFDPSARPDAGVELRQRVGIGPDRVVALLVAQDFHRKGLAETIAALARVDARAMLLVVGKQEVAEYRKLAERLGVADRVVFAGRTDDPYPFYRAADYFVLPTRHDPCSLVVLEALAMGLPVISTIFNGACEIMESGKHGFVLTDPADVSALASSMRSLLDDDSRRDMAQNCLALRPGLAYERHLDELLKIYDRAKNFIHHGDPKHTAKRPEI